MPRAPGTRRLRRGLAATGLAVGVLAAAREGAAENVAEFPPDHRESRAHRHASLDGPTCRRELVARHVPFVVVDDAPGVLAPVRLEGRVGGVLYRTDFPDERRGKIPWEIFDCRLVLALADLSVLLRAHDVVEVRMFSAYRPPSSRWPAGKVARRHPGALAIDVRALRRADGEELVVSEDWVGRIGQDPCGTDAAPVEPDTPRAHELRALTCQLAEARLFHSILTPNYDRAHFNHFHLELAPGVQWFIAR